MVTPIDVPVETQIADQNIPPCNPVLPNGLTHTQKMNWCKTNNNTNPWYLEQKQKQKLYYEKRKLAKGKLSFEDVNVLQSILPIGEIPPPIIIPEEPVSITATPEEKRKIYNQKYRERLKSDPERYNKVTSHNRQQLHDNYIRKKASITKSPTFAEKLDQLNDLLTITL